VGHTWFVLLCVSFAVPAQPSAAAAPEGAHLAGLVLDISGAAVPGAHVRVEFPGGGVIDVQADRGGRFQIALFEPGPVEVIVWAPGFERHRTQLTAMTTAGHATAVRVVLSPAPIAEVVTVTASRGEAAGLESAAAATIVTSADLLSAAALTLDDHLRSVPGFSLFRRSSSRVANPTTQGVTLRGLTGSGASRALVLADGLALNDAFGGWIYWNRIPVVAIDRVEVVRGGGSELYGADALGGVIQILTLRERAGLRASLEHGSHATSRVSLFGGAGAGRWSFTAAGELSASDGYHIVSRADRGLVDVRAGGDHRSALLGVAAGGNAWRADLRANFFSEERHNGTPLQVNDTSLRQVSGMVSGFPGSGAWTARAFAGSQDYHQTFSAIAAGRGSETMTLEQRVPSRWGGLSGEWLGWIGSHHLLVGAEARTVDALNEEGRFVAGQPVPGRTRTGGEHRMVSLFSQATLQPHARLIVAGGLRGDVWRLENWAGVREQQVGFAAPRASVSWRLSPAASLRGALHGSFRTPTLNELYRGFRVGNVLTEANPGLGAERATGLEAGLLLAGARTSARVVGFWTHLSDPIANVTRSVTPTLIVRQRQNVGAIRARGLEMEGDLRLHRRVRLTGMAALGRSEIREAADPRLVDNRVPQAPLYQFGAGVRYADSPLTLSAQFRYAGQQFEDDLNTLSLRAATLVDVFGSRALARGVHGFLAVENLLDTEHDVGRTPVRTIGLPRTVRAGVRVFLP
jgi:outer membrane cobalamin receptor